LIVRYPLHADAFINAPLSFSIFEPAHFVMESGMMLGIKERAESTERIERAADALSSANLAQ
jgi:hypothetical protein